MVYAPQAAIREKIRSLELEKAKIRLGDANTNDYLVSLDAFYVIKVKETAKRYADGGILVARVWVHPERAALLLKEEYLEKPEKRFFGPLTEEEMKEVTKRLEKIV